ncbi:PREDICTED: uncharacterized protein LOC108559899 [Nicrophorus vespilloides]|uniref:Uncharacterized protein LOC108559899 n=1 Tax=Nicrophorus vespilloides TaxID=110193 RepID=A0ABM1MDW4_NICVS|nr:PREDICTED: uncharacterized protein LOC108559899 [Nicrophorus vespilloides]
MEVLIVAPFVPIIFNIGIHISTFLIDKTIILWSLLVYMMDHPFEYFVLVVCFYTLFEVLGHLLIRKRRPHLVVGCCCIYIAALEIYDTSLGAIDLFSQYVIIFTYMFGFPRYYKDKPIKHILRTALIYLLFANSNITLYCNRILHFHILFVAALTGGCFSVFLEYYITYWFKGEEEVLRQRRNSAAMRVQQ